MERNKSQGNKVKDIKKLKNNKVNFYRSKKPIFQTPMYNSRLMLTRSKLILNNTTYKPGNLKKEQLKKLRNYAKVKAKFNKKENIFSQK